MMKNKGESCHRYDVLNIAECMSWKYFRATEFIYYYFFFFLSLQAHRIENYRWYGVCENDSNIWAVLWSVQYVCMCMYAYVCYNVCVIIFFFFSAVVSILFCLFCLLCMVLLFDIVELLLCMLQHIIHVFFHRNKSIIVNINVSTLANMPFSPRLLLVI